MFELKIVSDKSNSHVQQLNILKNTFESLSSLLEGINISFTSQGMQILAMDTRNVCYCEFHISSQVFSEYRCDRDLTVGIKLKSLLYSLKTFKMEDIICFKISCADENENIDKLNISIEMESAKVSHNLKIYQFESEIYELPEMKYTSETKIPISKFLMAVKSLDGDLVDMSIHKDHTSFSSEGEHMNSKYSFSGDDVKITCSEPIERQIATKYLNAMTKGANLAENVEIMMGRHAAVVFTFNLLGMGHLTFYVAPTNDEEEDE